VSVAPSRTEGLESWWRTGDGGPGAYAAARSLPGERWRAEAVSMPSYDGPAAVAPPDRPTPLVSDLPEIRAFRALLQDAGAPMDTLTRRVSAITQAAQDLDRRPLAWSVAEVAERCARLAESGSGVWALLDATREFWAWHPDHAYAEAQVGRMADLLAALESEGADDD